MSLFVCCHLLWSLTGIDQVLRRWRDLLLFEGFWHTGAGLHAQAVVDALPDVFTRISVKNLSHQPELWGGVVTDERYVVLARA